MSQLFAKVNVHRLTCPERLWRDACSPQPIRITATANSCAVNDVFMLRHPTENFNTFDRNHVRIVSDITTHRVRPDLVILTLTVRQ